jgi:hypothetical protein
MQQTLSELIADVPGFGELMAFSDFCGRCCVGVEAAKSPRLRQDEQEGLMANVAYEEASLPTLPLISYAFDQTVKGLVSMGGLCRGAKAAFPLPPRPISMCELEGDEEGEDEHAPSGCDVVPSAAVFARRPNGAKLFI